MLTFGGWDAILTKSVGDTDKKSTDKTLMWGLSSAGRASALQAEGHRFEPYRPHRNQGWIPEWPKGADCKSVGTAFEGSNPPLATYGTLEKSRVLLALWTV